MLIYLIYSIYIAGNIVENNKCVQEEAIFMGGNKIMVLYVWMVMSLAGMGRVALGYTAPSLLKGFLFITGFILLCVSVYKLKFKPQKI